jgi:uncharacterized membrane protein YdbT with pleckstrin-like domain
VFAVTGLPASLRDDQDVRMRRYLVSMGVRTTCFVLAVVAIVALHWTLVGWILVVAAVILPYIAVVMANATRSLRGTYLGPVAENPKPAQLAPPVIDKDRPE